MTRTLIAAALIAALAAIVFAPSPPRPRLDPRALILTVLG